MAGSWNDTFNDTSYVAYKLFKSTGNAFWITATTFLVVVMPLIVEMDKDQSMSDFENQQLGALTGPSPPAK
ncbi:hypothetical protein WJX74_003124 [Apatococcus lobatus]|uniref:Mitochondrial import receptor subunit TOM22 homolog n=1 Tax=Apatococcus lobatus TaxID=904363 RepID=A0AAW1Q5Q2_9CHLO